MVIISLEELEQIFSERRLNDTNEKSNDGDQNVQNNDTNKKSNVGKHNVQDNEATILSELLRLLTRDVPRKPSFRRLIVEGVEEKKIIVIREAIKTMADPSFHKIYLFTKIEDSPVVRFLRKYFSDFVEVHKGLNYLETININNYFRGHNLVIFDNLCNRDGYPMIDESRMNDVYIKGPLMSCSVICFTEHPLLVNKTIKANTGSNEYYKRFDKVLF